MITLHYLTMKIRLGLHSSIKIPQLTHNKPKTYHLKLVFYSSFLSLHVSRQQPQGSAFLIAELGDIFGNLSKLIKFSTGLKMKVENQRNIQTKKTKTRTVVCLIFRTFVFSIIGNCLLL